MPWTKVPQDLSKIKPKTMAGLTKRQLILMPIAAAIGVLIFFALRTINTTLAALIMVAVVLPIMTLSSYEKDGRPAEYHIKLFLRHKKLAKRRPYRTSNLYKHFNTNESEDIAHANHKAKNTAATPKNRKQTSKGKNNKARTTAGHKK